MTEKATEEPQDETPKRRSGSSGVAYGGKAMDISNPPGLPNLPSWPDESMEDQYIPQEIDDISDLRVATREMLRLRVLLHKARRQLDQARREETAAMIKQRQHYSREFIKISGGTEATRKAVAEIQNEAYMSDVLIAQAVAKEKMELSRTIAKEIEAWKTICDNIRKQMSI